MACTITTVTGRSLAVLFFLSFLGRIRFVGLHSVAGAVVPVSARRWCEWLDAGVSGSGHRDFEHPSSLYISYSLASALY